MLLPDAKLKELILKTGLVNEEKLEELISVAKNSESSLSNILVERDIISDENLGLLIADELHVPFIVLSKIFIPDEVKHIIPPKMARKYKAIPFGRDTQGIKIAMADPSKTEVTQAITQKTGQNVNVFLATERDIYNSLQIYQKELQQVIGNVQNKNTPLNTKIPAQSDVSITKIVDSVIEHAYQDRASDVHIEAEENNSVIRFRIDGILHDVLFLPKGLHEQVIARIKVLSRLRTDEHLSPQDGKMRMKMEDEDLDIRVSILPMVDGEKAVLRLLSSHFQQFSLVNLGMNEKDLAKIQGAFTKSFGMILSTGPTGSGKSTSIYAILKILNTREKNITTIEDPVEYRIKGVNQIQVNAKTNLTFAAGLRSILRQDPNIIFVGEIRDNETAGIAVNAALTGHLVLSTLHTNDAATALPRFTDMGLEPYLIASTVNVIVGQRLVRKICEMCKSSIVMSKSDLLKNIEEDLLLKYFGEKEVVRMYKGHGCKVCHMTGYKGRIGIFEVLEVTATIRELIAKKITSDIIAKKAQEEGMTTMFEDGLQKIAKGMTTLEEILRVTKVESL
ncbi:MAG TPA: ATPase, T2SS/T4P/T4SS family [Candidatus Saccharimonadales bacterium]|nr:ATPase, T2SS/T4P/T4SS family [Candidatus Saccharimonadales bacterium]